MMVIMSIIAVMLSSSNLPLGLALLALLPRQRLAEPHPLAVVVGDLQRRRRWAEWGGHR